MPRTRSIARSLAFLALTLCARLRAAEPPWLEIHSTHFTVVTDAGEKRGREVALRFEQMRSVFAGLLGKDRLQQSRPLTILAFKDDKSFYQLAPLRQGKPIDVPGFFLPGDDQDFVVLNLFEDQAWRAVAHDYAISLLSWNYPPAQPWFDEGLAEYFSSMHINGNQVEIGGDPELIPSLTEDLVGNQQETHPPKSLTELLGAQVWLSLPDLFSMKHDPSTRNQGTRHVLYYAQSWIVMHYLLHEKKLPETGTYFGLVLNQHVPVEEAIQKAYGMSAAQLEQAVKDYFHSLGSLTDAVNTARQTNVDPDRPTATLNSGQTDHFPVPVAAEDSSIIARPLPEADARALYAGLQVRIPERRDAGLKSLQELATTPTEADKKAASKPAKKIGEDAEQLAPDAVGNALAHRFLAWDHIEHGEFEDAFTEIGDAASLNPRDMWLRYYLSVAKYRVAQAKHADMSGLANMMLDLKGVLDWNPEMADAYDLLGLARNSGGSSIAAMQAARAAIALSPRNELYVYHLAQIYVSSKKWEAAGALLDRLKSSNDPQVASLARNLLSEAGSERKYGIPVGSAGASPPKYEAQKSPFDVLEQDAAKRAEADGGSGLPADQRSTKFVKGRLVSIDCSKSPAAMVLVRSDAGTLKLRVADYKSLLLIGANDFSCEWRDLPVTANYKPRSGSDGDLVSLEVR